MTTRRLLSGIAPLAMLLVLLAPAAAPAQVTTGNIVGQVISATDRSPVPGATVTIVHVPTGSSHVTVTGEGGEFTQINAKPGGPYTVRVELDGFQTVEQNEVRVALGATTRLEVPISMTAVSEEITVTGSAEDLINPSRQGSQSELDFEEIQAFPTVRRNALLDGAKTNPYASIRASDENQKDISFAGRSSKYNNIQIDGSNYNDLFGLGESGGTPGGQSNAQPIQQDVIQ
jgi:hypothetical protein